MSKYTTEVRYICETLAGLTESQGFNSIANTLTKAAPLIFNFDWPIFDENYRLPLEIKILRHYYTREIGAETVGLWKLQLQQKLYEIMPYYNQLYKSELIEYNPLIDVDLTTDHKRDGSGEDKSNGTETTDFKTVVDDDSSASGNASNSGSNNQTNSNTNTHNNTAWDMYSDTPQGSVQNIGLENNNYLTNARKNTDNGTITDSGKVDTTSSGKNEYSDTTNRDITTTNNGTKENDNERNYTSTETYLQHVKGRNGSRSAMQSIQELRETFLNIDKMILDDLAPLFFNLW